MRKAKATNATEAGGRKAKAIKATDDGGRKKGFGSITKMPSGVYRARWAYKGKCYTKSTGTTDKREALAALDRFTAPFRLGSREETAAYFQTKVEGIVAERREWEAAQPGFGFEDGWTAYENSQSRPRSGAATLRNYRQWFFLMVEWLKETHPEVVEMRQVTQATANEYAAALLNGTGDEERGRIMAARAKLDALRRDEAAAARVTDEERGRIRATAERKVREAVRGTTFNRHMNALALAWRHVALNSDSRITANPWAWDKTTGKGIRRIVLNHAEKPHRRRALTVEEVYKIMQSAEGEMRVLIALGFYTGLRLGDCVLLKWANIDRVRGVIENTSRKTDTDTRTPVHPDLAAILERADTFDKGAGYVLPGLAAQYLRNTAGRVDLSRAVAALFQSVGIETSVKADGDARARPDCGFHSLRHTFATLTQRGGAERATAQKLLGHNTASMTEHYTHDDGLAVLALPSVSGDNANAGEADDTCGEIFRATIANAVAEIERGAKPEAVAAAVAFLRKCADDLERAHGKAGKAKPAMAPRN